MKPTFTWGQTEILRINASTQFFATSTLLDVALPRPAVCQVYFRVQILTGTGLVWVTELVLLSGIGRTMLPRVLTYPNQPAVGVPLEIDIGPFPLEKLNAQIRISADPTPDPEISFTCGMEIAPFTTVEMESPKLEFAPMLPGEGDELDASLEQQWPLGYEPMEEAIDPEDQIALRGRLRP